MTILQEIQRKRRWNLGRVAGANNTLKQIISICKLDNPISPEHKIQNALTTHEQNIIIECVNKISILLEKKEANYELIKTFIKDGSRMDK